MFTRYKAQKSLMVEKYRVVFDGDILSIVKMSHKVETMGHPVWIELTIHL